MKRDYCYDKDCLSPHPPRDTNIDNNPAYLDGYPDPWSVAPLFLALRQALSHVLRFVLYTLTPAFIAWACAPSDPCLFSQLRTDLEPARQWSSRWLESDHFRSISDRLDWWDWLDWLDCQSALRNFKVVSRFNSLWKAYLVLHEMRNSFWRKFGIQGPLQSASHLLTVCSQCALDNV